MHAPELTVISANPTFGPHNERVNGGGLTFDETMMKNHAWIGLVAVAFSCMLTSASFANAQAGVRLRPSDARSSESFNHITGVRELSDGTVLVVDARDARVASVHFDRGVTRTIGRKGSGPGEYRAPARIFALAKDSSLLTEHGSRWFLMAGDSIVSALRGDDPVMTGAFARMALGADVFGGVLALSPSTSGRKTPSPFDSISLVRIARTDGAAQTLAMLRPLMTRGSDAGVESQSAGPGSAPAKRYVLPLNGPDHVVGFCDGWTAVVRRDPFGVEWIDDGGSSVVKTAAQRLRTFTRDDQAPLLHWLSVHTGWPPTNDVNQVATWPSHAPRIVGDADGTVALANGMLLVHQPSTSASPRNVAQVYTRSGSLHTTLTLPAPYRVVGSGRSGVYIAVRQDDGTERLQRHPAWNATDSLICGR